MKTKLPTLLVAALAAVSISCTTVTGPDGTVTKTPDKDSVATTAGVIQSLISAFARPQAAPVVIPAK